MNVERKDGHIFAALLRYGNGMALHKKNRYLT